FSPDGKTLAALDVSNNLRAWDAATGEPAGAAVPGGRSNRNLLFSPDGRRILAYGGDQGAVFDLKARKAVPLDNAGYTLLQAPRFSAAGGTVEGEDSVRNRRTWDAASGRLLSTSPLSPPTSWVAATQVSASPDGKHVAVALSDGRILAWDAAGP